MEETHKPTYVHAFTHTPTQGTLSENWERAQAAVLKLRVEWEHGHALKVATIEMKWDVNSDKVNIFKQ